MATFEELRQRYMLTETSGGSGSPGAPSVAIFSGCEVIPLVDGPNYFQGLRAEIGRLGTDNTPGQFIYIAGWWCANQFSLDAEDGANKLADLLIQKSRAGVDVRVLGWVLAPEVMQYPFEKAKLGGIFFLNRDTMGFIKRLQAEPTLANKACLNILAHPAGACHLKMAMVGTPTQAIGFTGGLDLEQTRHSPLWRDVQIRVTGPAVQSFFDAFCSMWNEIRTRLPVTLTIPPVTVTSHTGSMPDLPPRSVNSTSGKRMHVQSVRTLPRFNFATPGNLASLPHNTPLSYAPMGLFEAKAVWEKALKAAEKYIYIEDQAFFSREVFDWANAALRTKPKLKVVLLTGRVDPNDNPSGAQLKLLPIAVNDHLLAGLSASDYDRIGLFSHSVKTVHSKTSMVDDNWAMIGSTNAMRRSLYTDFEHSVAYMDEEGAAVTQYRDHLWGTYFQQSFQDIDVALGAWFAIPFSNAAGTPRNTNIKRLRLPLPATSLLPQEEIEVDEVLECDSRDPWGGALLSLYAKVKGAGSFAP